MGPPHQIDGDDSYFRAGDLSCLGREQACQPIITKGISVTAFYSPYDVTKEPNHEMIPHLGVAKRENSVFSPSQVGVRDGEFSILNGQPVAESIHILHHRSFRPGAAVAAALAGSAGLARRARGRVWHSRGCSNPLEHSRLTPDHPIPTFSKRDLEIDIHSFYSHPTPLEPSSPGPRHRTRHLKTLAAQHESHETDRVCREVRSAT